jgi:membrane protease YdiL (CAAX protease family)
MNSSILLNPKLFAPDSSSGLSTHTMPPHDGDLALSGDAPPAVSTTAAASLTRPGLSLGQALAWTLGYFVAFGIIPFVLLGIWAVLSGGGWQMAGDYVLHAVLGGQLLGVCWSVFALRVRVGRNWPSAIHVRRPALVPCLLAVLCLPVVSLLAGSASLLVNNTLGTSNPARELVSDGAAQHALWFCLLVIAVGAAVNEELFCRGFLGRGLVGRYGVLLGVLFTSSIFAIIHCSISQGLCAFILGCFFHLAYLATRSLWVPILLHFLNNACAVIVVYLFSQVGALQEIGSSADQPEMLELFAALAIAFLLFLVPAIPSAWGLYRMRDRQIASAQVV